MEKLTFRHELKYYINESDYAVLSTGLAHMLKRDRTPEKTESIRSGAFTSTILRRLRSLKKWPASQSRAKYRIRIYDYSDRVIKFEKKIKEGQYIAKKSLSLTRSECDRIIAGDPYPLLAKNSPYAREIFLQMKLFQLKPVVVVDYEREAFVMVTKAFALPLTRTCGAAAVGEHFRPKHAHCAGLSARDDGAGGQVQQIAAGYIRNFLANMACNQRTAISKYVSCRKYER